MSTVTLPGAAAPISTGGGTHPGPGHAAHPQRHPVVVAPAAKQSFMHGNGEMLLAAGVVAVVALLVMPLPPFLLDALLATSFALSIVILLVTMSTRDPLEFSIFPSLLLLVTLLRLGLNVSTTRLILSTGHAGQVIAAFGNFVIGGNIVVGLVLFLILIVINFMVITKGAGRVAEVAARFTLDAMPGRQMSIDADLSAGLIDEVEAKRRREEISAYADFYGSMDGAAKFVRGDAVAGLVITAINLVGGFIIGMTQQGMSAGDALRTFSMLTIGDGLVTQIPALIVSTASGLLVTYGSAGKSMAPSLGLQLTRDPRSLYTAGGILALFGLVPGLPTLPFLTLAVGSAALGWYSTRANKGRAADEAATAAAAAEPQSDGASAHGAPAMRDVLSVEPLEMEVGYALIPLVDESQQGDLLQRIGILRKQLAFELGVLVPPVRIRDNIQLGSQEYVVRMRGVRIAAGEVLPRHLMALDTGSTIGTPEGIATKDPSFGLRAVWVSPDQRASAEALGWNVVEASTVLATHLMEIIRHHSAELLTRQNVREMIDGLKETHPALVEDVVPGKLSLGTVHRVLQRLLKEGLPVRDLGAILEVLSDAAELSKDPEQLTEHVRRSLAPVIAQMLGSENQTVRAITVGPRLEVALMQLFSPRAREGARALEPEDLTKALQSLHRIANEYQSDGTYPPLITPPGLRIGIRRLVEPILPRLPVISLGELPTQTPIQTLRMWELH
ncbi:MAG: flagellar biosynthesis protein FlhA [Candidatus Eisenbacteria bacterium]|nr:flagellar biosynthesis protein FlhA [Candidatus Eisenbacteria bacterium]